MPTNNNEIMSGFSDCLVSRLAVAGLSVTPRTAETVVPAMGWSAFGSGVGFTVGVGVFVGTGVGVGVRVGVTVGSGVGVGVLVAAGMGVAVGIVAVRAIFNVFDSCANELLFPVYRRTLRS